ncbi:MAG: DUF4838 domain-containing protein [Proteobacteria bacterium]|nr:DUF4838 domain-containing protein [Pseudomonadota bacterium]
MKAFLMALIFATTLSLGSAEGQVELVKDGKAVAEIVLAKDANQSMKLAAKDIQEYLQQMSGADLPIVDSPTTGVNNQVYSGASEFTKRLGFIPADFKTSGYEIVAKTNYVILAGLDRLSKETPFGWTLPEKRYLNSNAPKPKDFPSAKLKAWQDFCGEKFTPAQLDFGGKGKLNSELEIYQNDDVGTWYAASELLEQLGVRFYAPYENGTVVPEMENVAIKEQVLKREASFGRREWSYKADTIPENIEWFKRLKSGNYAPIIFNHTTVAIYASKEQHELHPEYLACDAQGKPYPRAYGGSDPDTGGVPRYTNPDFRRASVVLMNKLFDASPELHAVALGPPDGGVQVDARDIDLYGKEGDTKKQKASNYVWDYHVFLAKKLKAVHPDKFLLYMAGAGAEEVPTNIKEDDPDNIILGFAQTYSAYRVLQFEDNHVLSDRKKWLSAYKQRGKSPVWDYYLYYRFPSHPRFPIFFTEHLQYEMQEMLPYSDGKFIEINIASQSNGAKGKEGARIGEPAITHLMYYWQSRLFWDPNADRNAILEEYYQLYFGPAADEMKEFHEFAEEVWSRQESRSVTTTTGFLKQEDIDKYFDILTRARAKAGKDTVYDKRIVDMEKAYVPLKNLFVNLQRKGPEIRAYVVPNGTKVDGDLSKYKYGWQDLYESGTNKPARTNGTRVSVSLSEDRKALYVAAICYENNMGSLNAETKVNDAPSIFDDDVLEIYVNTPERSFFKSVVNPNGAIWDESQDVTIVDRYTLPLLWNPRTQAAVKKYDDRWEIEMMIPTEDMGNTWPTKQYPWGIQIGRTRFTDGKSQSFRLAPGVGRYDTPNQWCNLWIR